MTLLIVSILIIIGMSLIASASPAIAMKIGFINHYQFIHNHTLNIILGYSMIVFFSCLSTQELKILCTFFLGVMIILTFVTLLKSTNIKGAKRWISIVGFSLQPSEFIKPTFSVFCAWILSNNPRNCLYASFCYLGITLLLLLQPDFGMFVTVSIIFFSIIFLSRTTIFLIPVFMSIFSIIVLTSYLTIPHVKYRVDNFFNSKGENNFQVQKATESLARGGLLGVGPSEGKVKMHLPDAHTDFIFSVAGEEFGLVLTLSIVILYLLLIITNLSKISDLENEFSMLAGMGIISYLGAQCLINISVNLNLIPTKGMTLPFISYGGSSMISSGMAIGIMLALTRKKYNVDTSKYDFS